MTRNDDFEPERFVELDEQIARLEHSEKERRRLEQECYRFRQTGGAKGKQSERQRKLETLTNLQEALIANVEKRTELLKMGRPIKPSPDMHEQRYNECVGYAYGKAYYVDTDGVLFYCETQEDAVELGETMPIENLLPFDELLPDEQSMILEYLVGAEDIPDWFRNRIRKWA